MKKDTYTIEGIEGSFTNKYLVRELLSEEWERGNSRLPYQVKKNGVSLKDFNELK